MPVPSVELAPGILLGGDHAGGSGASFPVIAGPCVIESEGLVIDTAHALAAMAERLGIGLVFKSSFDKANRSALGSFRGPGLEEGLRVLRLVRAETGLPVLTDVHEPAQCAPAAEVCDVLQIPAFLCRQTDLVVAAAATGRPLNIKKGQFMAPDDMRKIVDKARSTGNDKITVTERGVSFGYHNLVVDMRSFELLHADGIPVIYDVTHSLQLPGGGTESGGERRFAEPLARAAVAAGADGVFLEIHPDPERALSDSAVQLAPERAEALLKSLLAVRESSLRAPREIAAEVLETEAAAIRGLLGQLDERFDQAVDLLRSCTGRVVCTGMGKSGLIMKKIAATLSSTGTPSFFLHPAEALHGDLGMIVAGDVVLAASYSGTNEELLRLVETLKRLGVPLVTMTANERSPLARHADLHLPVAIDREACPLNLAPTASTTATLAMGDALAMALLEARGFTHEDFALLHPGGRLGKRLLKVRQLMHAGDALPAVRLDTPMRDAIYEMSRKKLGITAVLDAEGRLAGCISDGDLRRGLEIDEGLMRHSAGEVMTRGPRTISGGELAAAALKTMEDHRITSLFVCAEDGRLEGVVHLHDLWRLELF